MSHRKLMINLNGSPRQLFRPIAELGQWLRSRFGGSSNHLRIPASLIAVEIAPSVEAAVEAAMNVQRAGSEEGCDAPSLVAGAWARVITHTRFHVASPETRADVLNRFAGSMLELYQVTGNEEHASAAISAIRASLGDEDPGHRSRTWSDLAFVYSALYMTSHDEDHLREALIARRTALDEEIDPEQRPALYNNLAITLLEGSESHLVEVYLDEAIQALRTVTKSGTIPSDLMAEMSNNLAGALVRRFDATQSETDLRDAAAALDAAIRYSPAGDEKRPMYLENSRICVQKLRSTNSRAFRIEGMDLALFLQNRIIEGSEDSSDFGALSHLYHERYTVTGQIEDLVRGRDAAGRAMAVTKKRTREWATALASQSGLTVEMFGLPGGSSLADLNQAVDDLRQALEVTGKDEPERAGYLNVLAVALTDRYEVTKDVADLVQAGQAHIGAVDGSQEGNPLLPQFVTNRDKFMAKYRHYEVLADVLREPSIVELSDFIINGILTEDIAHERAVAGSSPTPTEFEIMARNMAEAANDTDLYRAYLMSSLLLQRLGGSTSRDDSWARVATIYLERTASWLAIRPDEVLLGRAHEVRATLINWVGHRETECAARALMAAALLDIDAVFGEWRGEDLREYRAMWNGAGFWDSWLRPAAATDRDNAEDTAGFDSVEAAEGSLKLLGRARQISDGSLLGTVLRQTARIELLAHELGRPEDESVRYAYEALKNLKDDTPQRIDLWFLLISKGEHPSAIPPELLPRSWAVLVGEVGLSQALTLVHRAARSLSMLGARAEAGEWLRIAEPHLFEFGSQLQRQRLWAFQGHYLDGDVLKCPGLGIDVRAAADGMLVTAANSTFSPARISSGLVHLAYHAHSSRQYSAGVDLIERALKIDPGTRKRLGPVYSYIGATLWAADASDSAEKGDLDQAAHGYAVACDTLLNLGLSDAAIKIAASLCLCAQDRAVAPAVVTSLTGLAPRLLAQSAGAATFELLENFRSVIPYVTDVESVLLLHQITKGLRFAIAITAAGPVAETSEQAARLAVIKASEALILDLSSILAGVGVDDEMVLSSYIGSAEMTSGRAPQLVAANLQRHYDNELAGNTLRSRRYANHCLSLSEVQDLIGDNTVLLSIVLTGADAGNEVQLLTVTRREAEIDTRIPAPGSIAIPITILLDDFTVQMHALGPRVAQLRREIRDDPLFRTVTRRGEELLASSFEALFPERLESLRLAGKTHLCIWPQGPLHLLPFHLLRTAERTIADDWTVSIIPSLRSLTVQPPAAAAEITMLSIGSADGGIHYGLALEPSVEVQAAAVAAVFGAAPLLGADATPARLLQTVPSVRYLHIAAHGSINEIAPAFQCVYLAPTSGNDGRLYAHDLQHIDLRGLDIVTLSTCESALGRFDFADDMRGLPAALFFAGVKTIVGCLWPVNPDAAEFFFPTFYEQLLILRNRLDAFRQAQVETRRRYPAYRDWGAFTFMGQWREAESTRNPQGQPSGGTRDVNSGTA